MVWILPSLSAPNATRCSVLVRLTVVSMTCGRVMFTSTGRFNSLAAMAAITDSGEIPSFEPNPPPT